MFETIKIDNSQRELIKKFNEKFESLYDGIGVNVSHSRALTLCFERLKESSFWLNRAISEMKELNEF